MELAQFWKLIESSKRKSQGDLDEQVEILCEALQKLDAKEIVAFDALFTSLWGDAYRWDLWAAAYILGGGCSDDGFMDFRGWLISRGQKTYENALANPDSLARVVSEDAGEDTLYEGFQYVASQAWGKKTGQSMHDFPRKKVKTPKKPKGKAWDEDDLESVCPKLFKKFDL